MAKFRSKFTDEEREAIHALLISWKTVGYDRRRWWRNRRVKRFSVAAVARIFRTDVKTIRKIERDFAKPYYTTDELTAAVLIWARKNQRWPSGSDWNEFSFHETTFRRRFNGLQGFQRFLLNVYDDDWIKKNLTGTLALQFINITDRRRVFEMFGVENVIKGGGGVIVQKDDYGTLWQLPRDNEIDFRTLYVEVVNSTKNEKGKYDHYFLRVPPSITTARQAVRWTFNLLDERFTGTELTEPIFGAQS